MGPALAAGNVQIIKPAEQTPLTDAALRRARTGGAPPRRPAGRHRRRRSRRRRLVRHPAIRLVSLTGDTATGKLIAKNAADTVKHVHLELGGKAPMVVLDDADPETVAEAIKIGGYFNSGQDCTASSRILVDERIYDDVLSATSTRSRGSRSATRHGRRDRHGPGHLGRPAGARARLPRACRRREGDRPHRRRRSAIAASSSSRPSSPRCAGRRDRPERGLRPRRHDPALLLRRRGDRDGERRPLRARRRRSSRRTSAGR